MSTDEERLVAVPIVVDDDYVATHTIEQILDPIWWRTNMYGTRTEYVDSQASFSDAQRLLYAVYWYLFETGNGGHDQFFFNSTGVVLPEALQGLQLLSLREAVDVLQEAAGRVDAAGPSLERSERNQQLDEGNPAFDDLDERLAEIAVRCAADDALINYARSHPAAFRFAGAIHIPESEVELRRRLNAAGGCWAVPDKSS